VKDSARIAFTVVGLLVTMAGSALLSSGAAGAQEDPGDDGGCGKKQCVGDACGSKAGFNCSGGHAYYSIGTGEYLGCAAGGTGVACCSGSAC
jgi:hypothetical protein